ncbi:MAG: hypothetical protein IPM24_19000 [Bryobacterales bacterium]|nr:hypothetical protein [Bryobacterales bacterium]
MRVLRLIPVLLLALSAVAGPIPADEARRWTRWLLPHPKEVRLDGKVVLPAADVAVRLRPGAGDVEREAASGLQSVLRGASNARFEILIGVQQPGWEPGAVAPELRQRLAALPNRGQAYAIQPVGETRLILTALEPDGVAYAARTLHQLLEPTLDQPAVAIPLATVVDWPDFDERGLWNFPDAAAWVPWMAGLKLNYGKMATTRLRPVERGGSNGVIIETDLYARAKRMAFRYVPYIVHVNFLHDTGLFRAYPELAGRGDEALAGRYFAHKRGNQHRAPFAAHPEFQRIVTEWLEDLAAQGVDEVSCWLSERPAQDQRPETTAVGQFVLEGRAFVNAWREVRRRHPDFRIRLFLSTVTTERDYRVLAEAPPEVKIERACATALERVTRLPRDLFRYPLLDQDAAEGRWIASYDVPVGANARVDTPEYMVPQTSAHRIRDYVRQLLERKYSGAYGMLAWANRARETYGFSTAALAEYSWNVGGRATRDFALAWATRERYRDPEAFADWSEIIGPVAFDVYDSEFPIAYSWGRYIEMVRKRQRPYLGEGPFRYYSSREDFDAKLAACDRALPLARRLGAPVFAQETAVVRSYVRLARAIYEVAEQLATDSMETLESQARMRERLAELEAAGKENATAIRTWRTELGPESWDQTSGDSSVFRALDAIRGTETTVFEIKDFVEGRYFY